MQFHVDPGDELPLYRQIMRQVLEAVAGGQLSSGDQLPSHRDLAERLVIAPLTVKKAYDELERAGYLRMARGQGSFITGKARELDAQAKLERLRPLVRRLLHEAVLLGVDTRSVKRLFDEEGDAARELTTGTEARTRTGKKG
ncbi:MAG TPA: GntR family transcriptional regulator [Polyangiaceae bacterium]|nr:GntR family transcriptional regulator [Polyangiaceae bacterium]